MKSKKTIFALTLATLGITSCVVPEGPQPNKPDNEPIEIRIGANVSLEAKRSNYEYNVLSGATTQLAPVSLNEKGFYEPQLTTFETKDNKTYTFKVREGMKWHDGTKVTAEDILYTLKYEDEFGNGHNFKDVTDDNGKITKKLYESFAVSDDKTIIVLTLTTANVRYLSNLVTLRIMPKHIFEGKESEVTDEQSLIGCGPFKFKSFDKNANTLIFEKFEECPIKVKPDKLIYTLYKNDTSLYQAMKNNTIDTVYKYSTGVSKEGLAALKNDHNIVIKSIPGKNVPAALTFNNSFELFKDLNVKNAISYALEYDHYKTLFSVESAKTPNRSFIPTSQEFAIETTALETNLSKATELLNKSGYTKKDGDKYFKKDNKNLEFTLTTKIDANNLHPRYGDAVKTSLEKIGIKVNLESLDTTKYNEKASNKFSHNNVTHEAAIFGYTPFGLNSGAGFGAIYMDANHPVQGGGQVKDQKFSEIITKLTTSKTLEEYSENAKLIQKYYETNIPAISLFSANTSYVFSAKYDNFAIDSTFGIINYKTWENISKK